MNDSKNTMYQDFIAAQKEFEPARRTSNNPFHKSMYADLSVCIDAVKSALNNNGFSLIQKTHDFEHGIAIETVLYHKSGESISSGILRIPAAKQDPQGYGSTMTYARRYSLMAICGIAPEDDDANSAKPPVKSMLQQKIDNTKVAQTKMKTKESLVAEGEKAAAMGLDALTTWFKGHLSKEERELIKDKTDYLKSKCPGYDDLNQDVPQ